MGSRQAIVEFANLLTVGSDALEGVLQTIEPTLCAPVAAHLAEVAAIAKRLREIADALATLQG